MEGCRINCNCFDILGIKISSQWSNQIPGAYLNCAVVTWANFWFNPGISYVGNIALERLGNTIQGTFAGLVKGLGYRWAAVHLFWVFTNILDLGTGSIYIDDSIILGTSE